MASSLTTAAGFVGLLLIEHNGIKTIGALAVLGILTSMTTALLQGTADPRVAAARTAEMERRRALLDDADAMGRGQGEQRVMQARADRS